MFADFPTSWITVRFGIKGANWENFRYKVSTQLKTKIIFGMKIRQPITKAIIENIRTAPALKSFIVFILGSISIEIKSHNFSMDVLIVSKESTPPININTTIHSQIRRFKVMQRPKATSPIIDWMRKFLPKAQLLKIPSMA